MPTVFIWNNNQVTQKISKQIGYSPSAKDVIGHACMNIHDYYGSTRDRDHTYMVDNQGSHVSWWPTGEQGANKKHAESTGGPNPSLFADILTETYVPDHIIRIETPPPAFTYRMEKEWQNQLLKSDKKGSYHFLKENCSRVVSRVLRRGFNLGRGNIKYGQTISGVWTPLIVKRLAMDVKGGAMLTTPARQMLWDEFVDELVEQGAIFPQSGSLLKLLKRRASNRGSSGATPRFDFSKEDGVLERFQKSKLHKFRGDKGFPLSIIAYSEARGRMASVSEAVQICANWMAREIGDQEFNSILDSGLFDQLISLAEQIPSAAPKRPPRKKRVKPVASAAGAAPPKPPRHR